eukprot:gene1948-33360_t
MPTTKPLMQYSTGNQDADALRHQAVHLQKEAFCLLLILAYLAIEWPQGSGGGQLFPAPAGFAFVIGLGIALRSTGKYQPSPSVQIIAPQVVLFLVGLLSTSRGLCPGSLMLHLSICGAYWMLTSKQLIPAEVVAFVQGMEALATLLVLNTLYPGPSTLHHLFQTLILGVAAPTASYLLHNSPVPAFSQSAAPAKLEGHPPAVAITESTDGFDASTLQPGMPVSVIRSNGAASRAARASMERFSSGGSLHSMEERTASSGKVQRTASMGRVHEPLHRLSMEERTASSGKVHRTASLGGLHKPLHRLSMEEGTASTGRVQRTASMSRAHEPLHRLCEEEHISSWDGVYTPLDTRSTEKRTDASDRRDMSLDKCIPEESSPVPYSAEERTAAKSTQEASIQTENQSSNHFDCGPWNRSKSNSKFQSDSVESLYHRQSHVQSSSRRTSLALMPSVESWYSHAGPCSANPSGSGLPPSASTSCSANPSGSGLPPSASTSCSANPSGSGLQPSASATCSANASCSATGLVEASPRHSICSDGKDAALAGGSPTSPSRVRLRGIAGCASSPCLLVKSGWPSQGQADGVRQLSQGQPSQGQPSQGQPSQGQPSQGQPSQGQPSQGQAGGFTHAGSDDPIIDDSVLLNPTRPPASTAEHVVPSPAQPAEQGSTHDAGVQEEEAASTAEHVGPSPPQPAVQGSTHDAGVQEEEAASTAEHVGPSPPQPAVQGSTHDAGVQEEEAASSGKSESPHAPSKGNSTVAIAQSSQAGSTAQVGGGPPSSGSTAQGGGGPPNVGSTAQLGESAINQDPSPVLKPAPLVPPSSGTLRLLPTGIDLTPVGSEINLDDLYQKAVAGRGPAVSVVPAVSELEPVPEYSALEPYVTGALASSAEIQLSETRSHPVS